MITNPKVRLTLKTVALAYFEFHKLVVEAKFIQTLKPIRHEKITIHSYYLPTIPIRE